MRISLSEWNDERGRQAIGLFDQIARRIIEQFPTVRRPRHDQAP